MFYVSTYSFPVPSCKPLHVVLSKYTLPKWLAVKILTSPLRPLVYILKPIFLAPPRQIATLSIVLLKIVTVF